MKQPKKSNISSKSFDTEDVTYVDETAEAALRLLGLEPSASAEQKMTKITKVIDEYLYGKEKKDEAAVLDLASQLACLYGNILRDEVGWEWRIVSADGDEFLGIGPADKSVMLAPVAYIHSQLTAPGSGDNTSMLLFNMIKGGTIPKGKADEYVSIG